MFGITDIATYTLGVVFIILLPGPNTLYVLSVAAKRGVRQGFQAAFGVFLGDAILMVLSAVGMASVLKLYPSLFVVLKYMGGAYLTWIGLSMLKNAWHGLQQPAQVTVQKETLDTSRPFRKALLICLVNPKAILFFMSFFTQFVDPQYPYPVLTFAMLGAILQAISALYLSVLIVAGTRLADVFRQREKLSLGLLGTVGAMFVGFGVKLVSATL